MKYPQFLASAKRHRSACSVLLKEISEITDRPKRQELLITVYYLSGYIIECALKFKIFEVSSFDEKANIEDNNKYLQKGFNYKENIRTHNFCSLQNTLSSLCTDISYENNNPEQGNLISEWEPKVRYENKRLNQDEVILFFEHANNFLKKVG